MDKSSAMMWLWLHAGCVPERHNTLSRPDPVLSSVPTGRCSQMQPYRNQCLGEDCRFCMCPTDPEEPTVTSLIQLIPTVAAMIFCISVRASFTSIVCFQFGLPFRTKTDSKHRNVVIHALTKHLCV